MLTDPMWSYQNIFSRMQGGVEDEMLRDSVDNNLGHWMKNPGFREWW